MFSAPDILKMAQMASRVQMDNTSTVQLTEITHIIVFNDGGTYRTYAMRFDNLESIEALQNIANDNRKSVRFNRELKDLYESDYNYQTHVDETDIFKQQHHLFKILEDYNLNISLYEANFNDNGRVDNWQKINKNTLEQEPCN